MSTPPLISIIANIVLTIALLSRFFFPNLLGRYKAWRTEQRRIKKQAFTKAVRKEVRDYLNELQK